MFNWIGRRWRHIQRRTDIEVLWPICLKNAPTIEHARFVFMVHTKFDPAWSDLDELDIIEIVNDLPLRG